MNWSRWSLLLFLVGLLAAGAAPSASREEEPRDWTKEYRAFRKLDKEKQRRLRQLDRALQEEDRDTRNRLLKTMQRYTEWLDRLPAEDHRSIEEAESTQAKLQRIREIRERQWIATLPKADRDRISDAKTPQQRQQLVAAIRKREYAREMEWMLLHARFQDQDVIRAWLKNDMGKWLREELQPKLTPAESKRLKNAQARDRLYLIAIIELANKHQVPLPEPLAKLRPPPPGPPGMRE